ncbi:unnamed protein product [Rangifer tarandus platyrhynchus]|uniref:Uncharacterized protein n=1 Tax=Rangifer tarandus platyrhynchus TaxID=3082113 RepID=A0ABN8ZEM7_RANTA|nr:unnamed protein product [Rangifer tarandus platyrhynchus]
MVKLRSLSCFSCVQLFVTLWTVTHQAPLSMGFSRQEYWSGLPCPSAGGLADPGTEPGLLHCRRIPYCLSHRGEPQSVSGCLHRRGGLEKAAGRTTEGNKEI